MLIAQHKIGPTILIVAVALAIFCPMLLDGQQASPQALYDKAGKALDAGDAPLAIKLYQELLSKAPDSVDARVNLGVALAHEGRYDDAVEQYRHVLQRNPQNETALLNLALAHYKEADFTKARNEFLELHKLRPSNQQAFYLLADCDLRLGNFQDAIALVQQAYETHPDDAAVEYLLGTALIQDGQTQKGAAVIDRMMRNGNSAVASVLLGASQYAAGDYKASAATLHKALDLNPALPGAWTIYGRALLSGGENEEAKAAFQRALQADANDFDACLHLGALLRHDGDLAHAGPYLKHALMLRPDSATALFQVSALDAAEGHLQEAKTGFEKLVTQWPDFVEAHVQLAMIYSKLHQGQDSERERRIVVELNDKARAKGPRPEPLP